MDQQNSDYRRLFDDKPRWATMTRRVGSSFVLMVFIVALLVLGILDQIRALATPSKPDKPHIDPPHDHNNSLSVTSHKLPDFSRYIPTCSLNRQDLRLHKRDSRVIIVGDIHGHKHHLKKLLRKLSFDHKRDSLVTVGDVLHKVPLEQSLDTLSFLTSHNITGVRGNHDQRVIEWRGFFDWVKSQKDGERWLNKTLHWDDRKYRRRARKHKALKWHVSDDWEWGGSHFEIAWHMSPEHYNYLLSLPVVLHLAPLHIHVVHGGLLPLDPTRPVNHAHQPLSHVPRAPAGSNLSFLRNAQELAVLNDIKWNRDSFVKQNIRSVTDKGEPTRIAEDGTPWSELWNAVIERCHGFRHHVIAGDSETQVLDEENEEQQVLLKRSGKPSVHGLPCHPITVVYGHAASRGLDLKRWSKGMDTGCVNGRRLSALVIGPKPYIKAEDEDEDDGSESVQTTSLGESGEAYVVSVRCSERNGNEA